MFDSGILSMEDLTSMLTTIDFGYLVTALSMLWVDNYNEFLRRVYSEHKSKYLLNTHIKDELGVVQILTGLTQLRIPCDDIQ